VALALKSPNDDEFQLVQFKSASHESVTHETLPLTHYRMGWVIHQARAIYVPNLDAAAIPADNKRWRSFIAAPLVSGGQVTGAIAFLARKPGGFRQSDLKIVNILASICSSAITGLYIHNKMQCDLSLDPVTATNSCAQLVAKWPRMEERGAVAVVDLKKFGKVNMELGLAGGDAVLVELATRLKKVIGEHGDVSRFGGAKFIVVIKGMGKKQASALLGETMRLIEEKPFHYQGVDAHITPVMGVSFSPDDGVETEGLLYRAYGALQAAKSNVGAQLRFHGDDNQQAYGILRSLK
jgi:diguanylate cyclase (GGDEF)-like protein